MTRLGGRESITILRAQTSTDPYSQAQTIDWSLPPARTVVYGCTVEPGASTEYLINRDYVEVAFTVDAPKGTDVTALDRVEYNGTTYEVFTEPKIWNYSPSGRLDYVEVMLKERKG